MAAESPSRIEANTIFFDIHGDRYVVMNWFQRRSVQDAAVVVKLSSECLEKYSQFKSQRYSDKRIFRSLFPNHLAHTKDGKPQYVPVDIALLTQDQLADSINVALGLDVPSFRKLPAEDLRLIYKALVEKKIIA